MQDNAVGEKDYTVITGHFQDLLIEAEDLPDLQTIFESIRRNILDGDIDKDYLTLFIEGIEATIKNYCMGCNFGKDTADTTKTECVRMLRWLTLTNFVSI